MKKSSILLIALFLSCTHVHVGSDPTRIVNNNANIYILANINKVDKNKGIIHFTSIQSFSKRNIEITTTDSSFPVVYSDFYINMVENNLSLGKMKRHLRRLIVTNDLYYLEIDVLNSKVDTVSIVNIHSPKKIDYSGLSRIEK